MSHKSPAALALHELAPIILATENYVEHEGQILMHRRSASKSRFPGFLIGPGGRIDAGEDVIAAAAREIKEETGIAVPTHQIQLKAVAIHHHLDRNEIWTNFITRALLTQVPAAVTHSDEGTSEWLPLEQILNSDKVFEPSRVYLEHVTRDAPGILYNYSEWRSAQLVRVLSQTVA